MLLKEGCCILSSRRRHCGIGPPSAKQAVAVVPGSDLSSYRPVPARLFFEHLAPVAVSQRIILLLSPLSPRKHSELLGQRRMVRRTLCLDKRGLQRPTGAIVYRGSGRSRRSESAQLATKTSVQGFSLMLGSSILFLVRPAYARPFRSALSSLV